MGLLSRSCEYGLRAMLFIGQRAGREYVSIKDVSDGLDISFHFLTKILQQLTEHGLLRSMRGPGGGVALARPARSISLADIVRALDGDDIFRSCALGLSGCSDRNPCPLHTAWAVERARLEKLFRQFTLERVAHQLASGRIRLSDA